MSYKKFLHNGPNERGLYQNDPLDPLFLDHFSHSNYCTTRFRKKLAEPSPNEDLYNFGCHWGQCYTTSLPFITSLLNKYVEDKNKFMEEANYLLRNILANHITDFTISVMGTANQKFEKLRGILFYDLILSERLFVYMYDGDYYVKETEYFGQGYFQDGKGLGLLDFAAEGYHYARVTHW